MKAAKESGRRLATLSIDAERIEPGAAIFRRSEVIGRVTSSAFSPRLRRVVAFAELVAAAGPETLEAALPGAAGRAEARLTDTAEGRLAGIFREKLRAATESGRPSV
jgi:glycine cleavage system aminomethyltransferase T